MRHIPSLRRVAAAGVAVLTTLTTLTALTTLTVPALGALAAPIAVAAPDDQSQSQSQTQTQTATGDPSSKITADLTMPDGTKAETVENRWFVQLSSPGTAAGGSQAAIEAEHADLAKAIKDAGIDAQVTTEYETLWNGVAL